MTSPSGRQHRIEGHGYAVVVTEAGATLRVLTHDGVDLVQPFGDAERASGGHGQLLAPWPNRVVDARWSWHGDEQRLAVSEPARGHANHGLVRWQPWWAVREQPDAVTLATRLFPQPGWPGLLDLEVDYSLGPDGLSVRFTATNRGADVVPFAVGAHPYLVAPVGVLDDWHLELRAGERLLVDERMAPTGREAVEPGTDADLARDVAIDTRRLDTAYTGLERDDEGRATVRLWGPDGRGVHLWMDERMRWAQVYTGDGAEPPRTAVAVEPMTAPPDALNSDDDLAWLEPGAAFTVTWGLGVLR